MTKSLLTFAQRRKRYYAMPESSRDLFDWIWMISGWYV